VLTDEERKNQQKICSRRWYERNRDKAIKKAAVRRKAHPEKAAEYQATYRNTHPEKVAEIQATYYNTHPEKEAKRHATYRNTHPEEFRLSCAQRRAFKCSNTPISDLLTSTEWLLILALADGHCAYCDKEAKLTLDHVIPLSKGGKHSKDNVVAACGHCNSSKGNRTLEEWNAKRLIQAKK
jgi:5-methylcytosine-specific restriction endonuclease McrA